MDIAHYQSGSLAAELVNTHHPWSDHEHLAQCGDLAEFLLEMDRPSRVVQRDLDEVREVRERLREVFAAPDQEAAVRILNRILAEARAVPHLVEENGAFRLHYGVPERPIAHRLAATAALELAEIIEEDGFERLGICEASDCRDVFVDRSRNRSKRYCSPAVCGNRESVRAHRARQKSASKKA